MDEVNVSNLNGETKKVREEILINQELLKSKRFYLFLKRIIDILGSAIGLVVLSPIFLIVAYKRKKEDSSGPIFFSQERVGKNGKSFKMYKFRSMCVDAEEQLDKLLQHNEVQGAMFKMKEDPRVTKIGKFIRRTSIDELPQLWNVLNGDMSLVGPRPPLSREVSEYSDYAKQRLLVKPGCTGLWQVSGRNHVGFDEMVDLDLKYITNQSIINDVLIIVKTFKIILMPNGAY